MEGTHGGVALGSMAPWITPATAVLTSEDCIATANRSKKLGIPKAHRMQSLFTEATEHKRAEERRCEHARVQDSTLNNWCGLSSSGRHGNERVSSRGLSGKSHRVQSTESGFAVISIFCEVRGLRDGGREGAVHHARLCLEALRSGCGRPGHFGRHELGQPTAVIDYAFDAVSQKRSSYG